MAISVSEHRSEYLRICLILKEAPTRSLGQSRRLYAAVCCSEGYLSRAQALTTHETFPFTSHRCHARPTNRICFSSLRSLTLCNATAFAEPHRAPESGRMIVCVFVLTPRQADFSPDPPSKRVFDGGYHWHLCRGMRGVGDALAATAVAGQESIGLVSWLAAAMWNTER
jgi:hypothetical protein